MLVPVHVQYVLQPFLFRFPFLAVAGFCGMFPLSLCIYPSCCDTHLACTLREHVCTRMRTHIALIALPLVYAPEFFNRLLCAWGVAWVAPVHGFCVLFLVPITHLVEKPGTFSY